MAPSDDTCAFFIVICLSYHIGNLLICFRGDLIHDFAGKRRGFVEFIRHFLRTLCNGFQYLGSVQKLTAYHKPKFIVF